MADYETLSVEQNEGVLRIALNRPKANTFEETMIAELGGH